MSEITFPRCSSCHSRRWASCTTSAASSSDAPRRRASPQSSRPRRSYRSAIRASSASADASPTADPSPCATSIPFRRRRDPKRSVAATSPQPIVTGSIPPDRSGSCGYHQRMHARVQFHRVAVAAVIAVLAAGFGTIARPASAAAALPAWTGGVNLYRSGVFTTQQTWRWCTAADVQIMRNIVFHQQDHSRDSQWRYYGYMRNHNRYDLPAADGVDPAGWAAGLRHLVDSRYHVVAKATFAEALHAAVTNLRKTQRPVGLLVAHGDHAWFLTGFTATADPAVTNRFSVTSVRVTGPLWGLQNSSFGYDMAPNTRLTRDQLHHFFTPWHYARIHMWWEGDYVSIQPLAGG